MALVARVATLAVPSNIAANRPAGNTAGGRNVASFDATAIEELSPNVGVHYGDSGLLFQGEDQGPRDGGREFEDRQSPEVNEICPGKISLTS